MGARRSCRTAPAKLRTPSLPISRSRRTQGKSRPARSRVAIGSRNTNSFCESKKNSATPPNIQDERRFARSHNANCRFAIALDNIRKLMACATDMNIADIRNLFDYTEWANDLAMDAANNLTDEQ